jgi:hypothetical protein
VRHSNPSFSSYHSDAELSDDEVEFYRRWEKVMDKIQSDPELSQLYQKQLDKFEDSENYDDNYDDSLWPPVSNVFFTMMITTTTTITTKTTMTMTMTMAMAMAMMMTMTMTHNHKML